MVWVLLTVLICTVLKVGKRKERDFTKYEDIGTVNPDVLCSITHGQSKENAELKKAGKLKGTATELELRPKSALALLFRCGHSWSDVWLFYC